MCKGKTLLDGPVLNKRVCVDLECITCSATSPEGGEYTSVLRVPGQARKCQEGLEYTLLTGNLRFCRVRFRRFVAMGFPPLPRRPDDAVNYCRRH